MLAYPRLPRYLGEYHAHYKNSWDLSTKFSLGKKYATGNQMRQKERMEKGSEEMKVPLKMDKHNDNDDLFPVHQQEQEQEQ